MGRGVFGLVAGALALVLAGQASAAAPCDSSCLAGLMDQYLTAVAARDPRRAPLAAEVRFTENAVALKPGQGLWATATGVGEARHILADPVSGQAAFLGTMVEQGVAVIAAVRLKIVDRKVTEAETIVVRPTSGLFNTDNMKPQPGFLEVTPAARRLPRETLVETANLYFEGLEQDTGEIVPFDPKCHRIENGVATTNNPNRKSTLGTIDFGLSSRGCKDGFNSRMYAYITALEDRRWLVDEEHQVALAFVSFVHDGTVTHTEVPGVGRVEFAAKRPFNLQAFEAFRIVDSNIREVTAVGQTVPYRMPSGW